MQEQVTKTLEILCLDRNGYTQPIKNMQTSMQIDDPLGHQSAYLSASHGIVNWVVSVGNTHYPINNAITSLPPIKHHIRL